MSMTTADRRGMMTLTVCAFGSLLALGIGWVMAQFNATLHAQLGHAAAREELDRVALQAGAETAYLLQMGAAPCSSRAAAQRLIRLAMLPGARAACDASAPGGLQDPNDFLRSANSVAEFAPTAIAGTLAGRTDLKIEAAIAHVLARHREEPRDLPPGKLRALPKELARLDLPWNLASRRVTWGILELAVTVRLSGRFAQSRRVARRHLFAVVDFRETWDDQPRSYACVFPDPLATTFE